MWNSLEIGQYVIWRRKDSNVCLGKRYVKGEMAAFLVIYNARFDKVEV